MMLKKEGNYGTLQWKLFRLLRLRPGAGTDGKGSCLLRELGQIPFLPVARNMGDLNPVYLEAGPEAAEEYSLLLQLLEKKGLVSLDFDKPLKGFDDAAYAAYPIRGSMALTERGQKVLEMLDYQGITQE